MMRLSASRSSAISIASRVSGPPNSVPPLDFAVRFATSRPPVEPA